MKKYICFHTLISIFLLLLPATSLAQQQITWYQMNLLPVYIHEGAYQDQGLQDLVDKYIKDALEAEGYTVEFKIANMSRIMQDLREKKHVGCGGLLKTPELEKFIEFSIPHSITLTVGVIIKKNSYDKFAPFINEHGCIELEDVLTQSTLRLGLASERPYTGIIDKILRAQKENTNISYRSGQDISKGLFLMLMHGRFDYTILFPWEARYIQETLEEETEFMSIPVQGMPPYVPAYAGVPKNEWGQAIIAILNPLFESFRNTPDYHEYKEFWLDDNSKAFYREYVKEYYGSQ